MNAWFPTWTRGASSSPWSPPSHMDDIIRRLQSHNSSLSRVKARLDALGAIHRSLAGVRPSRPHTDKVTTLTDTPYREKPEAPMDPGSFLVISYHRKRLANMPILYATHERSTHRLCIQNSSNFCCGIHRSSISPHSRHFTLSVGRLAGAY